MRAYYLPTTYISPDLEKDLSSWQQNPKIESFAVQNFLQDILFNQQEKIQNCSANKIQCNVIYNVFSTFLHV